jgi:plasmid stabilization system protein ParE
MSFSVVIARKAAREIEAQYDWLAARSEAAADRWRNSLLEAINTLAENAERFPEAPEAE